MFQHARIKLTLWYCFIIMVISGMFSAAIFRVLTAELDRFVFMQQQRLDRQAERIEFRVYENGNAGFARKGEPSQPAQPFTIDSSLVIEIKRRLLLSLGFINLCILISAGAASYMLAGKTLQPIKKMVEEQHRFISDASHELRTPLTALLTTTEVQLREKKLSATDAKKVLQGNLEELKQLKRLTDSLLTLASFESDHQQTFESVSLQQIIKKSLTLVQPLAKKKTIEVQSSISDVGNINGNAQLLTELFVILLDNAVKYSATESTVRIAVTKNDGRAHIAVEDQGVGIDSKDIPHIFDRFFRTDLARTKKSDDGFGLGLSIAKKIVEQHKGSIQVESTKGKGSTFTVVLPR